MICSHHLKQSLVILADLLLPVGAYKDGVCLIDFDGAHCVVEC